MSQVPRVAIVGRPNVGKSTLFNRIAGRRRALVGDEPGMTRDRLYARAQWLGKNFEIIDTGGLMEATLDEGAESKGGSESSGDIAAGIIRQVRTAIDEAAEIILVVDAREGLLPLDEELARRLRATGKPLTVAVNKLDSDKQTGLDSEFHQLGIPDTIAISAEHGQGIDDLLDTVTAGFEVSTPADPAEVREPAAEQGPQAEAEEPVIHVAIIGRPNVGKSTLLNQLLKEERSMVSPVAGTTRDAVDADLAYDHHHFRLIDTAGIRRKGKTHLLAEKLSVIQARKHLERSDVALLLIDALEGVTALDTHIAGYAYESHRSVILVVNKWDAVAKGSKAAEEFTRDLREKMKFLAFAPVVFVSALRGQRLGKLLGTIVEVAAARRYRVPTSEMNRFVERLDIGRASIPGGRPLRLYYLTQAGVAPPTFVAFINRAGKQHFSVERFLENRIRERFNFTGTPLVIEWRRSR